MAKKNKKKNQKQVDWTSPPPSPKPALEEAVPAVPTVPGSLPLSPDTAATSPTQDDPVQSLASPTEAKIDEPPIEVPTSEPATQETATVEDTVPSEQKEQENQETNQPKEEESPPEALEAPKEPEPDFSKDTSVEETTTEEPSEEPPSSNTAVPSEPPVPESEPEQAEKKEEDPSPEPAPAAAESEFQPATEPEQEKAADPAPVEEPTPEQVAELTSTEAPASSDSPPAEPEKTEKEEAVPDPVPVPAESEPQPAGEESAPKSESVEATSSPAPAPVEPQRAPPAPEEIPPSPRSVATEVPRPRASETSTRPKSPPKPDAVNQVIEESRPPAPTPPVSRVRPRHAPAFDDDDEDDSALIQPRLRSEALSRDPSRGSTYPPPSHSRSLFASRVPVDPYSNPPPPPPPPPGYHPRYYPPAPPAAPPYYHNHNHSYSMSQSGYSNPNHYGPPSHASSSPYQESWGQYPPSYPPHGSPPQRHDSMGSRDFPMGPARIDDGSALEDDPNDLFSRIASAIPDLHVLLARYKETHGQLGVREELLRRASAEQQEKLRAKDEEIAHLKEKVHTLENKHSSEASRLRLEIGNMEEQMKELREQIAETEKFKEEAEQTRQALDAAMTSWETKYKELEATHSELEKAANEEKAKVQKDFEEWKSTATTKHDAEKIALAIQFDKKLKEADVIAENQRQEAAAAFVKEKDELRSEHQRQQRERESSFDRVRKELETKLGSAQLDREEALRRERESHEVWSEERATLLKSHQEDRDSLRKGWEEQRELLEAQYKKAKDESDKAWIELHAEANKKAEDEKARADELSKHNEELQKKYNELKAENEKEKEVIKSVAGNLESEKARLEKLMECYGDIAEIKSKGDTYYLLQFSQLQKQILDLASTHFVHLPVTPPPEDLAQIPSGLPSFLGDTGASRSLRAAYIAHTVSKMITFRVFGPFLFSLGRRYDKADSLFLSMSNHIRDKSTRKEAIWRQQTLLAAFTSSGAKQRINTAAGTVVEEIVNAIKNFADPREEEGIKIDVKRIVKLAAETWRFARLEREMITARMPALHDEEHEFTGPEYWPAYRPEGTPIASLAGTAPPSDEPPKLLLRLFPVIVREPKHENFRDSSDEKLDEGCVYHHGLALYDDAEPVVQRAEELKAAGLPPLATASPTAADFPPPLMPAPRNPPPPTPTTEVLSDKASIRSKSKSPPPSEKSEKAASTRSKSPSPSVKPERPASIRSEKAASVRSGSPPPLSEKAASVRSKSPPPPSIKSEKAGSIRSSKSPPPSIKAASVRSATPPPAEPSEPPLSPKPTPSEHSQAAYTRPPPGPIDFNTPRDIPPLPEVTESGIVAPSSPVPSKTSEKAEGVPPLPPPTETDIVPPEPARSPPPPPSNADPEPTPAPEVTDEEVPPPPLPAPTESAIIPANLPLESARGSSSDLPTPPHSRSGTPPLARPVSPLFAALDEIEALSSHRSRNTSTSRRSARSRKSDEELGSRKDKPETIRRTSGYALSTSTRSSSIPESLRTERTDRTERTERSSSSRYMCESRSAAIKALYPNSPLAGQSPTISRRNSTRKDRVMTELGTWDTNTQTQAPTNMNDPESSCKS